MTDRGALIEHALSDGISGLDDGSRSLDGVFLVEPKGK